MAAVRVGLPPDEAEACYHHYNAQGWRTGTGQPITNIGSIVAKWQAKWRSERKPGGAAGGVQARSMRDINEIIAAKNQLINDLRWDRSKDNTEAIAKLKAEIKDLVAKKAQVAA